MEKEKISIVVIEDNELMLSGIVGTLSSFPIFNIVGTASKGKEGLNLLTKLIPDVALVDIRLPEMNGIDITKNIKSEYPNIGIVIITSMEDDEWLYKAFLAGANAYTLKDINSSDLFQVIKMVSNGLTLIQPTIAKYVLGKLNKSNIVEKDIEHDYEVCTEKLTEREKEILSLIAKGYKNKQIAEMSFITEGTVKLHINNILRKLGVSDRTQAILKAIKIDML